jgi:hypothetical protein
MREKIQPWMSAIFCAFLSLMTFALSVSLMLNGRGDMSMAGMVLIPFLSFLPMCFFHVGTSLSQLRKENQDLRAQIQELTSKVAMTK